MAGFAQLGSAEKSAFRSMEKHRWQKAEGKLRKTLMRDTLNPSTRYVLSIFYFEPENPAFHLDSAYHYVVTALDDFRRLPGRERDRLKRGGIDSLGLVNLRARIDSAAFEVARMANTEAAYLDFLRNFPSAVQRELAVHLRDEVAYQEALQENTYQAFRSYINRYPDSDRLPEARANYHRLLYSEETKDKRLSSYEKFLADYPETPYRSEIYANIFEIATADGTVSSFLSFMARYPRSGLIKRAQAMVFYLLAEEEHPVWPTGFLNDSLQTLIHLNNGYWLPFLKNDHYGFMDENGREVIAPKYATIHPDYLCGNVTDEFLIVGDQLVGRNGRRIFAGQISGVTDIGAGFLMVDSSGQRKVIHKSGLVLADNVEDARIIARGYMAVRTNNRWLLYTLTGRLLDERAWENISALGSIVVFSDDKRKFIAPATALGRSAEGDPLPLSEAFDEVKLWPDGLIWGKSGEFEGVMNQSMESVIRFDRHVLTQTSFGALARVSNGFVLYNNAGRKSTVFDQVSFFADKTGVKKNKLWFLYNPLAHIMEPRAYDSLRAEGAFTVGTRSDSVYIHFVNKQFHVFYRPGKIEFVPGLDSTSFLTVQDAAAEKAVFDLNGRKLFSAAFDALEYAGKGLFVVTRKEKKGLLNMRGETMLPPEFDAIGTAKDGVVSILKNRKFGAYHPESRKLIKPQYDRNLIPYASSAVITFKDGRYGILGWDNKPVSPFEFEEVSYWNDSLALVKKGSLWSLFDLASRKLVETNLRNITMIRDSPEEKVAIIQRDNSFGVISNHGRIVIPPTFTEIINLGSPEVPIYFTEKHVPEASLYIVIYYDRDGDMIRKEIYDDAADYDKIYCPDK